MFRAHAPPQGACENLVCALKCLANQQTGGDSHAQVLNQGSSRAKQIEDDGRHKKIRQGAQPRGRGRSGTWRSTRWRSMQSSPSFTKKTFQRQRASMGHFEEVKKVCSAPSSTPPLWETSKVEATACGCALARSPPSHLRRPRTSHKAKTLWKVREANA